jgi:quercetin dioxygenase-like cupin family protein
MNAQDRIEWPIRPAPDPLSDEATCLLQGPLAEAWPERAAAAGLGERLARRAAASARRIGTMVNVPRSGRLLLEKSEGLTVHQLYQAAPTVPPRPGEPARVCWLELAPGAVWHVPNAGPGLARDWLLVRGSASVQTEAEPAVALQPLDYLAQGCFASRAPARVRAGDEGAAVLLRERLHPAEEGAETSLLSRDAPGQWQDYAPLIKRRVLWQHGPMAAMLWLAAPGAVVPQHRHGHDEECLMLRGDLFQDDFLLREGDYQLAPAGSGHETVNTDTGALIYAHGDLEMQVAP